MSKIELNYLIFDDDTEALNQYLKNITIPGFLITHIFINPADSFDADKNIFNLELFKSEIIENTKNKNINLIITDWNILPKNDGFEGIKGWDIIEMVLDIKEKWKSRNFLIYSSNIKQASDYVLQKIINEIKNQPDEILPSLNFISKIIELKIKFCKRDEQRFQEIITLLKASNTISNVVLNSIISFDQNMIINTGNSDFDGKKISDILSEKNVDLGGLKFIREFIELSISHYSDLNE